MDKASKGPNECGSPPKVVPHSGASSRKKRRKARQITTTTMNPVEECLFEEHNAQSPQQLNATCSPKSLARRPANSEETRTGEVWAKRSSGDRPKSQEIDASGEDKKRRRDHDHQDESAKFDRFAMSSAYAALLQKYEEMMEYKHRIERQMLEDGKRILQMERLLQDSDLQRHQVQRKLNRITAENDDLRKGLLDLQKKYEKLERQNGKRRKPFTSEVQGTPPCVPSSSSSSNALNSGSSRGSALSSSTPIRKSDGKHTKLNKRLDFSATPNPEQKDIDEMPHIIEVEVTPEIERGPPPTPTPDPLDEEKEEEEEEKEDRSERKLRIKRSFHLPQTSRKIVRRTNISFENPAKVSPRKDESPPQKKKSPSSPNYKYQDVVRNKRDRMSLPGHDCPDCAGMYKMFGPNAEKMMKRCSRHRFEHKPPATPPHFWSIPSLKSCTPSSEENVFSQSQ